MEAPLIPVSILNEYVYCPRLAHMRWVQGETAQNADMYEGILGHKNVDIQKGNISPAEKNQEKELRISSMDLSSESLGLTARIDLVEGMGNTLRPIEYKKGKRPHIPAGAYPGERVQLCAQGLLLRDHGFDCTHGFIYFIGSKERVRVVFDEDLIQTTMDAIWGLRELSREERMPHPLIDSPKCPKCSMIGTCLPDETGLLTGLSQEIAPVYPPLETALPLYVQSPSCYIRKEGERLILEEKKEKVAEVRLMDISQLVLFGHSAMSTPAMHACFKHEIPVSFMTYGGWFVGHSVGTGHKNVWARTAQYRASFEKETCLFLAKKFIRAKIANCRTLMRRNWKDDGEGREPLLKSMKSDIQQMDRVSSLETLLGVEGNNAAKYFQNFLSMISGERQKIFGGFDFTGRNRRPPKDPLNALLSFAYAMLTREWTITLSAVGLDPYRGFLHQPRFGRPALSLDMMEPFRPLVADSVVLTVINNGEIQLSDFVMRPGACNLDAAARKRFLAAFERRMEQEVLHPVFKYRISYRRLFNVQARLLVRYLGGEIPDYPDFVTR